MSPPDRSFQVTISENGQTLAAVLKRRLSLSWSQARHLIEQRRVKISGQLCADSARRVNPGQRIEISDVPRAPKSRQEHMKRPRKKSALKNQVSAIEHRQSAFNNPSVIYADDHVVVADKPPGLTTMRHPQEAAEFGARAERFLPPTLAEILPALLRDRRPLRAVHRLDRDTSGLVVFARTPAAEQILGRQFRAHTISRRYLALVRGRPRPGRIESFLVRDRGDGRRGSGPESTEAQQAVTYVRNLEELGPFTLVECRLETGRTHQVRIHLGEMGTPLCGERVYDRPLHGAPVPDESKTPRIALHAAHLGLHHPETGDWMEWESPLPEDLTALLKRLRA
jgi:23S rRNA pseudouridine1911/1915/1917 synthase